MTDEHTLVGGQKLVNVHNGSQCWGEWCTIHRPSSHHMIEWDQNWRGDICIMERVCPHGIGHPDPDDPKAILYGPYYLHTCDGCCVEPQDFSKIDPENMTRLMLISEVTRLRGERGSLLTTVFGQLNKIKRYEDIIYRKAPNTESLIDESMEADRD